MIPHGSHRRVRLGGSLPGSFDSQVGLERPALVGCLVGIVSNATFFAAGWRLRSIDILKTDGHRQAAVLKSHAVNRIGSKSRSHSDATPDQRNLLLMTARGSYADR